MKFKINLDVLVKFGKFSHFGSGATNLNPIAAEILFIIQGF